MSFKPQWLRMKAYKALILEAEGPWAPCCSVSLTCTPWLSLFSVPPKCSQMLHASKPLLMQPVLFALPFFPSFCLSICLANTYSSFQTQFKDHFIHSSTHSLLQPTLMEDSPYARTHIGEQSMVPVLTKLIIKSSIIGTYKWWLWPFKQTYRAVSSYLMLDNLEMKKLRHGLVKYISQVTKLSINRADHLISKYTHSKAGLLIIN